MWIVNVLLLKLFFPLHLLYHHLTNGVNVLE